MAEKKVGKADTATIIVRKENGDKIVARGHVFANEQVTLLKGQVLEIRREDGTLVFAQKDPLTRKALGNALADIDDWSGCSSEELVEELAMRLGIPT